MQNLNATLFLLTSKFLYGSVCTYIANQVECRVNTMQEKLATQYRLISTQSLHLNPKDCNELQHLQSVTVLRGTKAFLRNPRLQKPLYLLIHRVGEKTTTRGIISFFKNTLTASATSRSCRNRAKVNQRTGCSLSL